MMLDLRPILDSEKQIIETTTVYDLKNCLEDITEGSAGVYVKCTDHSGYIELDAEFKLEYSALCARCAEPLKGRMDFKAKYSVASELENDDNDEYIILQDGMLDLDDLFDMCITLNFPSKLLCDDGCKGLCVKCGANLNKGDCGCPKKDIDPRLEKLRIFLEDDK